MDKRSLGGVSAVREFCTRVAARWPDWRAAVESAEAERTHDEVGPVSVELLLPAVEGPGLFIEVRAGEALVGLGDRGPERLFIWEDPAELDDALVEVMNLLSDIRSAEVVAAWERHRFLWKTWESAHFARAADAFDQPRVIRVEAWGRPAAYRKP